MLRFPCPACRLPLTCRDAAGGKLAAARAGQRLQVWADREVARLSLSILVDHR
jgi:hypothetical protein